MAADIPEAEFNPVTGTGPVPEWYAGTMRPDASPEQPPLVPGGPIIQAGGGRDFTYKASNSNMNSPLRKAIFSADPALLKQLLERGQDDVHARDATTGECALHMAVFGTIVSKIPPPKGHKKWTPLVHKRMLQCIEILLEHGAEPNVQDTGGHTPMHKAVSAAHTASSSSSNVAPLVEDVARRLLAAGGDLMAQDNFYATPRCTATMMCKKTEVQGVFAKLMLERFEAEYLACQAMLARLPPSRSAPLPEPYCWLKDVEKLKMRFLRALSGLDYAGVGGKPTEAKAAEAILRAVITIAADCEATAAKDGSLTPAGGPE